MPKISVSEIMQNETRNLSRKYVRIVPLVNVDKIQELSEKVYCLSTSIQGGCVQIYDGRMEGNTWSCIKTVRDSLLLFPERSGFGPKSDHCSPETSVKKTCYFHIWRDQILPNWDPLILTGFWRQKVSKSVSREANFRHWYLWYGAELKNLFVGTLIG